MTPRKSARPGLLRRGGAGGRAVVFVCLSVLLSGCAVIRTPSMAAVPPAWRNNHPWGPEANDARARGELPCHLYTRRMACWARFARDHLRDGDVVFRMGRSFNPWVALQSRVAGDIPDSLFSHDGIARWEGDTVWIYDAEAEGVRKLPFEVWRLDVADSRLAIRRLKPAYRDRVPHILAYCEEKYRENVPFDFALSPDEERLYCTELIEKAFRSAGIPLSEMVPIKCLPNYWRYRLLEPIAPLLTQVGLDNPIFVPGNACFGAYASPYLEPVYETEKVTRLLTRRRKPPVCGWEPAGAPSCPGASLEVTPAERQDSAR